MVFEEQRRMYIDYLQNAMREVREEAGLSQEELAERLDCSNSTIYRYESGKSVPTCDVLFLFAALMNIPLERLTPEKRVVQRSLIQQTRFTLLTQENQKLVVDTMNTMIDGLIELQQRRT